MIIKLYFRIGEINTNKNHEIIIRGLSHLNDKNKYLYAICGREVTEIGKQKN